MDFSFSGLNLTLLKIGRLQARTTSSCLPRAKVFKRLSKRQSVNDLEVFLEVFL